MNNKICQKRHAKFRFKTNIYMKRIFLLPVILMMLFSCSKDENQSIDKNDKILGEWYFNRHYFYGNLTEWRDCKFQDKMTFLANGTLTENFHDNTTCEPLEQLIMPWIINGAGVYEFHGPNPNAYAITFDDERQEMTMRWLGPDEVKIVYSRDQVIPLNN